MFTLDDGELVLAATDLTNHLACPHLTQQKLAIARNDRGKPPPVDDPHADLVRQRGDDHEKAQLAALSAAYGGHVDLSIDGFPTTRPALDQAAARTTDAMRSGEPLIFQAHFFDGRWQGRTDFLRRVARPSDLGDFSYEVIDTKLARHVKPEVVHQLSLYNRLLAEVQGQLPTHAYVILGDGTEEAIDLRLYAALHRHTVARLEGIAEAPGIETYPEPVPHCAICQLADECQQRRRKDDHLSLVANARRDHREQLVEMELATVQALGDAPDGTDSGTLGDERFATLHHQAKLQVESRDTRRPTHRHLAPSHAAGYAAVPAPDPADIFFDFEGDPYVGEGGIEYLWGWWSQDGGYDRIWAHDPDEEKAALERFVDHVVAERGANPGMHVFHYAAHERAKLASLAVQYATREAEVDQLLRDGVLVDLYAVVRHALQVGEESYSLKALERQHGFERTEKSVREGGGSIIAYERWLAEGDEVELEAIRAYNEEDCLSTKSLRDWLLGEMTPEAEGTLGVSFDDFREPEDEEEHGPPAWMPDVEALIDRLRAGLSAEGSDDTPEQAERQLMSHLLLYHYREAKPEWWRYFELRELPVDQLYEQPDALAGLERDWSVDPVPVKQSLEYAFAFPEQEVRLSPGTYEDPTTGESHNLTRVEEGRAFLKRGNKEPPPEASALIDNGPIQTKVFREALMDVAASVLADDGRFPAIRALLRREPPVLASGELGASLEALVSATLGLDESYLPVQGPPGTGKTYLGARMIVEALRAGRRVGITAQSHAAIQNMLRDVEAYAHDEGVGFTGIYKGEGYESARGLVEVTDDNDDVTDEYRLVAGTTWLFSRRDHHSQFDLLFVDEAGQLALANTVAAGTTAKNMVFLGDPQQLPQVTQASHPDGSGASVLEHVLAGESVIADDRGVLLRESWRMHPDVCAFVSERSYAGELHSRKECGRRGVDAQRGALTGAGLRVMEVEHEGRSQQSREEAEAIAAACTDLLDGATVTDDEGEVRALQPKDIMVVAPYNLAVRRLAATVPAGVHVGTVDRFQGQQAPVVFWAMTCSSGDDVPRGLDFLFSRNRFNVAVSRAECLAVLVLSPRLLDANGRTLEAMGLVNEVCRLVEMATASRIDALD